MNLINYLSKIAKTASTLTLLILSGCDSDNNSAELAKSVELESQRAKGTIIESVTISNDKIRLKEGETHQLKATGVDSNGETRDITDELIWTSSDNSIAEVNSSGLVTAKSHSNIDQGKITITGKTINDIIAEGEISVSDVAVSAITLKQITPATGNINTCINASIAGDVRYEDDYLSHNTIKNMSFTVDHESTAIINKSGILFTSSKDIENTTITAKIDNVSAQLTVTANPQYLDSIHTLVEDEETKEITLNIGERLKFSAQAKLVESISKETFNIDYSVDWLQLEPEILGITKTTDYDKTNEVDYKGTVLALTPGKTVLTASCGGEESHVVVLVEGDAKLEKLQPTDTEGQIIDETITMNQSQSIKLKLNALYDKAPTSLNVTEFSSWEIIGEDLIKLELKSAGTSDAYFEITSSSKEGSTTILTIYDNLIATISIDVEK